MKFFPFRLLILCILLPSVFYIVSLQGISTGLEKKYFSDLTSVYLGDTTVLLQGRVRLRDMVNRNINEYFKQSHALYWGVKPNVLVTTRDDEIIYPSAFDTQARISPEDTLDIAQENYELLNKGLNLRVDLSLSPVSLAGLSLMALYVLVDIVFLFGIYKRGLARALREEARKDSKIRELRDKEQRFAERIEELDTLKGDLESKVDRVKTELLQEREQASANEDGLLDEIVTLEEQLQKTRLLQKSQRAEIDKLREQIDELSEQPVRKSAKKAKTGDNLEKRMRVLYKHLDIHDKAILGITDMAEDMRIKAEEVILQLNTDPSLVTIKRKVFGKGRKTKVLEVAFGYNGRLYFRHKPGGGIEVLCVGTKNSQAKDLDFLDRV
jgi:predicted  nucleic acid-binding Zn-ribbon protein